MSLATRHSVTSTRSAVEARLHDYFDAGLGRAATYGAHFERLWQVAGDTVLGGKLVRPMLLLEMWEALCGANDDHDSTDQHRDTVVDLAVAMELLHYSFLLHDDVIDGDLLRRGRTNLIGALLADAATEDDSPRALHWAQTGGILMGDLLLAASHQAFARADLPHGQRLRLLDLLAHTIEESVAGEQTDVGLADQTVPVELATVLSMTSHKTGTYTFEFPLRVAAILADAPDAIGDKLGIIGGHLGLGFQLQDDLLSAFGDQSRHGKDRYSDLREGKQTAIIAHARHTEAWPLIQAHLGRPGLTEAEAEALSQLLTDCGSRAFVEDLVEEQLGCALTKTVAADQQLPPAARLVLLDLVDKLRGRRA